MIHCHRSRVINQYVNDYVKNYAESTMLGSEAIRSYFETESIEVFDELSLFDDELQEAILKATIGYEAPFNGVLKTRYQHSFDLLKQWKDHGVLQKITSLSTRSDLDILLLKRLGTSLQIPFRNDKQLSLLVSI